MTNQLGLFGAAQLAERATLRVGIECRVHHCGGFGADGYCDEHDTPEVRAKSRPAVFVYNDRRVVLESRPCLSDDTDEMRQAEPDPCAEWMGLRFADTKPTASSATARYGTSRPCWAWCRREPGACGGHPGSRYAERPVFPCLACQRAIASCQAYKPGSLCCSQLCADAWGARSEEQMLAVRGELDEATREDYDERSALIEADSVARLTAQHRALLQILRTLAQKRKPCRA